MPLQKSSSLVAAEGEMARLGHRIAASAVWEILNAAGIDPAPRRSGPTRREFLTAHCERIIGSIRREALDHVLILGEAHARQVLAAYQRHHNSHRPHQTRNQLPPHAHEQPAAS